MKELALSNSYFSLKSTHRDTIENDYISFCSSENLEYSVQVISTMVMILVMMLGYVISCHVISVYVMSCHVMLCYVMLCHVVS